MSYGEIMLYAGIGIVSIAGILLLTGTIICAVKRIRLKTKLYDKYGF